MFPEKQKVKAGLIYIDASHDEADVYQDLTSYWAVLEDNGVMFGDDYDQRHWPGVIRAVNRFARKNGLSVYTKGVFWILRKRPAHIEKPVIRLLRQVFLSKVPRVAVYGAGNLGRALIQPLRWRGIDVACVVDSNPKIFGKKLAKGLVCQKPQDLLKNKKIPIVIASEAFSSQIKKRIRQLFSGSLPKVFMLRKRGSK